MMTKTGTVAFSAPEIFSQPVYDEKVDIWSAGIVLYMMLSGNLPFNEENIPLLVHMITHDEPNMLDEGLLDVSEDGIELIEKMLTKNPRKRPSAKECLKHPWMQSDYPNSLDKNNGNFNAYAGCSGSVLYNASKHLSLRRDDRLKGKINIA